MALSTALSAMSSHLDTRLTLVGFLAHALDFVISFGVITLLFAMIFKYLPDVRVPWRKVWIGAIGTTLLFTIGKILLGLYLGRQSTSSAYGAAGSVIVILMWIYYASVILFAGAEFTQVYAKRSGAVVRPTSYAVPVTEDERAQQGMPNPKRLENWPEAATSRANSAQPVPSRVGSPGDVFHKDALGVISLMLTTGFVAGTLLQFKTVRKGIKLYGNINKAADAMKRNA
jgi:membrane protein